jgi:hypothetical protein
MKKTIIEELGMPLIFLEIFQWAGFNESDLEIFRHKVWEILKIWVVFIIENSINFKNEFKKKN